MNPDPKIVYRSAGMKEAIRVEIDANVLLGLLAVQHSAIAVHGNEIHKVLNELQTIVKTEPYDQAEYRKQVDRLTVYARDLAQCAHDLFYGLDGRTKIANNQTEETATEERPQAKGGNQEKPGS